MVKSTLPRKVGRDSRKHGPRSRGRRVTPSRQLEDDTVHMNQKDWGQEHQCRELLDIPKTPAASPNHRIQTWATISLDWRRHIHIETSPDLKRYEKELFATELQQEFLRCANVQEPVVLAYVRGELHSQQLDPSNAYSEPFDRRASNRAQPSRKRRRSSARKTDTSIALHLNPDLEGQANEKPTETQDLDFEHVSICISDVEAVKNYYLERFEWIQQLKCKAIALEWVKRIEPRKMSKYPYNGHPRQRRGQERAEVEESGKPDGEVTKPPWWPPHDYAYQTPAHQGKEAQLPFLLHILRYVHTFKPEITSVELKAASDKIPMEPKQRMWLDEIYKLRKQEERFENNEIDWDTLVMVRVAVTKSCKKNKPSRTKKTIPSSRARARARTSPDGSVTVQNPCSRLQQECFNSDSPASNPESHKPDNFSPAGNNTELQEHQQDRFRNSHVIEPQANSALGRCGGDLTGPIQNSPLCQYVQGSTAHDGGHQTGVEDQTASQDVYMGAEPAIEAQMFGFGPTGRYPAFDASEAEQINEMPLSQSLWLRYDGYSSPSALPHYMNQDQCIHPSAQNLLPISSQIPAAVNAITNMPGFPAQQPIHTASQSLAAPGNVSHHTRAYDSSSSSRELDSDQCFNELPNADPFDYRMDPNHLNPR